jgi:hypothetical protein
MADKNKKPQSPKGAYWSARRAGKSHDQAFKAGARVIAKNKKARGK